MNRLRFARGCLLRGFSRSFLFRRVSALSCGIMRFAIDFCIMNEMLSRSQRGFASKTFKAGLMKISAVSNCYFFQWINRFVAFAALD